MDELAQTAQKTNGRTAVTVLKLVLAIVALAALGFSFVVIDLPNRNYLWIAAEAVVAILLIMSAIGNIRRLFGGGR